MLENKAYAKLKAGGTALGLSMGLGVPDTGEALARSGADFVMVDRQHGNWDDRGVALAIGEILLGGSIPMARVARLDYTLIGQLLDKGMLGIIVPMVDTPEQAQAIADACLLPPAGKRSWGWNLASRLGEDYAARINDELFVAVQLESARAVRNAEAILAVEGISGCWTGPSDLALSLGFPPSAMHARPEHHQALETILRACRSTGKIPGIAGGGLEDAKHRHDQGFRFITVSGDAGILAEGARSTITAMESHMAA